MLTPQEPKNAKMLLCSVICKQDSTVNSHEPNHFGHASPHRGLPPCHGGGAYAPRSTTLSWWWSLCTVVYHLVMVVGLMHRGLPRCPGGGAYAPRSTTLSWWWGLCTEVCHLVMVVGLMHRGLPPCHGGGAYAPWSATLS